MVREAAIWHEGYVTALHDFDVDITDAKIATATKNPHEFTARTRLTDYERHELRNALSYHFEDCPGEWDLQAEIVTVVVERILSRRPERA